VEFLNYDEGLCVQCMHIGSYDDEPATVQIMHEYMEAQGYDLDKKGCYSKPSAATS
ncbi:MAG: GyrI-like domain-containing protein, partial [Clostridia bacterium]|nr:GyrI-like domain-containing protein [Clostridia bacterium]